MRYGEINARNENKKIVSIVREDIKTDLSKCILSIFGVPK